MRTKKTKLIHCKDVAKHICENLDENINSPICRKIKEHLKKCPDCAANLISLKRTIKLYRFCPTPKLSGTRHKKLLAKLTTIKAKV